ncbi:MAG: ATP-binding cassette domain-containing protein [Anaerolineales bacterium]|nr:ATP-binding cassette domain-containing protein [Anaerolineales bacterium]
MSEQNHDVMIEVEDLTKTYGSYTAVDHLNFSLMRGEVVGFLGPNGAGKTTTMRMLTGYMPPTAGSAYIMGHHTVDDSMAARQRLGYLPETVPLYPEMSVEKYLHFVGELRRVPDLWNRIDEVLQEVDLLDRAESFISSLSKGMRQRVGLAQALLHDPDVLILDEPTIGLDPRQIVEIRELITALGKKRTVLLSTHILAEVEQICNRVIMIINGRIWADMTMHDIQQADNMVSIRLAAPDEQTAVSLRQVAGVSGVQSGVNGRFDLNVDGRDETRMAVAETAVNHGWGLLELTQTKASLENIFLNKLREAETSTISQPIDTEEEE